MPPRGQEMFGSLVVCLPSRFTGGALSVRHQSKELVCDGWSSNPAQKIQWAAFFSDVEHEVLPVADGYRVTLTYNLYHSGKIGSASNATQSPFYKELAAALGNPHFMREGGTTEEGLEHCVLQSTSNGWSRHSAPEAWSKLRTRPLNRGFLGHERL